MICHQCKQETCEADSIPYRYKGIDVVYCLACTCGDCGDVIPRGMGICDDCHEEFLRYEKMHEEDLLLDEEEEWW